MCWVRRRGESAIDKTAHRSQYALDTTQGLGVEGVQCVALRVFGSRSKQQAGRQGQGGADGNGTKQERAKSPGVACHPGLLDPALATRGPAAVELWTHTCVWNSGTLASWMGVHVRVDQKKLPVYRNSLAVCRGQPSWPREDGNMDW